jgi:hypothetical protein
MLQIIETFENIQCDRAVLHVLADQVADVLARRRVDIFVARPLIDILAKRISQLDIETGTQSMLSLEAVSVDRILPLWQ